MLTFNERAQSGSVARLFWRLSILALAAALGAGGAQAKEPDKPQSVWKQEKLTGDWGGARTALKDRGVEITLDYIAEMFSVLSGGLNKRTSFEGRLELTVDTDLEKWVGWKGASTSFTVFQIHNGGYNVADNVGSLADPSNIDALPTTRFFSAWFQQNFFDDRLSIRIGQLGIDPESFTSGTSSGLINGTFGWPSMFAEDMINGGPAYPLAAPGVRLLVKPTDELTVLAAVLSGNPAGPNCNENPQSCNRYGTIFSFTGGVLATGEIQYAINQGTQATGLPGLYKLGAWYESEDFPDQRYGVNASGGVVSLANPTAVRPLKHRSNFGIYGVADQMVWRGMTSNVNLFMRGSVSPSDRNLLSYYVDGGFSIKGLLPRRTDDVLTFGAAYAKISRDAVALDQDMLAINGPPFAIRDEEVVFEASYAAQITPWWIVQPDLQYIYHPNGGQNPNDPTLTYGHTLLAGIRSTIKF